MNVDIVEIDASAARLRWRWAGLALLCVWGTVAAQPGPTTPTRSLAATCAACHGTDGRAAEGQAMPSLAGMARERIAAELRAFREASRPGTVMPQIAKGYSDPQIDALAAYFAGVPAQEHAMKRREVVQGLLSGGALAALGACATPAGVPTSARVVVIGAGYGGATAAKYVRLFSDGAVDVIVVEPQPAFVSCPMSNLVVGGMRRLDDITRSYEGLRKRHGVTVVQDAATSIDLQGKQVTLAHGARIRYDKLVLAPGVELMFDAVQGLAQAQAEGHVLQAWKAGPETQALARQVQAMRDGGVFAITVPEAPYRCPPGPYERASVVASYLKRHKPRSKVLILDANPDVVSKPGLFRKAWADLYPGLVEYRPLHKAVAVDARTMSVKFELSEDVKADVLNVLPPMRAGALAVQAGLANANQRWCQIDYASFASVLARDVHVVGDSILAAPLMPKSAHMANAHAKVAAAAIVAELAGGPVDAHPMLTNTCYSFVSDSEAIHVASVHEFVAAEQTFKSVQGSGGVSSARSATEAAYALGWAANIWADTLG